MAIVFECPQCSAELRVPDSAAGKQGSCPSCGQKMLVPIPEMPPDAVGTQAASQSPATAQAPPQFPAPNPAASPVPPADPAPPAFPEPAVNSPPGVAQGGGTPTAADELPDFGVPVAPQAPVISRRVRRRARINWAAWLIPLLLGGGLVAGIVFALWPSDALDGTLTGTIELADVLPIGELSRKQVEADDAVIDFVLQNLEETPQMLKSPGLFDTEIRGNSDGLEFRLFPYDEANVVEVDLSKNRKLKDYLEQHLTVMDEHRREALSNSSRTFFKSWAEVRRKDPRALIPELGSYRNSLCLTSMRGGFGHHVAAVAGKRVFQCVYENDGRLYFVVPNQVKEFELQARPGLDTTVPFPGTYTVKIKPGTRPVDEADDGVGETTDDGEGDES